MGAEKGYGQGMNFGGQKSKGKGKEYSKGAGMKGGGKSGKGPMHGSCWTCGGPRFTKDCRTWKPAACLGHGHEDGEEVIASQTIISHCKDEGDRRTA